MVFLLELELLFEGAALPDSVDDGALVPEALPLMEELPLVEPVAPGVVELLLDELGLVGMVVELLDELGFAGIVLELLDELGGVDGVVAVVLLVLVLLRSQPVMTPALATARTATRGMSFFMTSPFECGCAVRRSPRGARCAA